ncbi:MAG: universal stress protein [Deltaproteobacteria bacterium]|nr:universal stress protein [Deltaproteobacteria bacterium]
METCKVNLNRVLACLDLSSYSEITFAHALTLARALGAELIILNVINSRSLEAIDTLAAQGYSISREHIVNNLQEERQTQIAQQFLPLVGDVPTRVIFRQGLPWEEIIKTARAENASCLVMGTKGRSNLDNVLFGHAAEKVFRHAPCPVFSVRGPEHCRLT